MAWVLSCQNAPGLINSPKGRGSGIVKADQAAWRHVRQESGSMRAAASGRPRAEGRVGAVLKVISPGLTSSILK